MNRFFAAVREIIEMHGGTVAKFIGDAVFCVFGIPNLHEDDALRAVRPLEDIRLALPAIGEDVGEPIQLRTGINTGRVLVAGDENIAIGDAVRSPPGSSRRHSRARSSSASTHSIWCETRWRRTHWNR